MVTDGQQCVYLSLSTGEHLFYDAHARDRLLMTEATTRPTMAQAAVLSLGSVERTITLKHSRITTSSSR